MLPPLIFTALRYQWMSGIVQTIEKVRIIEEKKLRGWLVGWLNLLGTKAHQLTLRPLTLKRWNCPTKIVQESTMIENENMYE